MSIIWSTVWGILALTIMFITIKYYLPMLSKRVQMVASETFAISRDNDATISFRNIE